MRAAFGADLTADPSVWEWTDLSDRLLGNPVTIRRGDTMVARLTAPPSRVVAKRLKARGIRLIDESPRTGIRGSRVAFLHPASTGGVLTEIVQPAEGH